MRYGRRERGMALPNKTPGYSTRKRHSPEVMRKPHRKPVINTLPGLSGLSWDFPALDFEV